MTLFLPAALRARIEEEARRAFPRECCGLIEGVREGDAAALALHPAHNIAVSADRFEIAPDDHFKTLREARANGRVVIGCYHSHPNGEAKPSAHDLAGAGEDDFFWLIASLANREGAVTLAVFVYSAGVFLPAELSFSPPSPGMGADLVTSSGKARS